MWIAGLLLSWWSVPEGVSTVWIAAWSLIVIMVVGTKVFPQCGLFVFNFDGGWYKGVSTVWIVGF